MEHEHTDSSCGVSECGCGSCCCKKSEPVRLSGDQKRFLAELSENGALPLARFIGESSTNDDVSLVMLAPVHLLTAADDMDTVRQTGAFLNTLAADGLIALDYGSALEGYPYLEYEHAALYAYFCDTVREGAARGAGFLADTPVLERGSLNITALGAQSLSIS